MISSYLPLVVAIIKHQEAIIGPLAVTEAGKVEGLTFADGKVSILGDGREVLERLVLQYENIFGQASIEACKDAVRPWLPQMADLELPQVLL